MTKLNWEQISKSKFCIYDLKLLYEDEKLRELLPETVPSELSREQKEEFIVLYYELNQEFPNGIEEFCHGELNNLVLIAEPLDLESVPEEERQKFAALLKQATGMDCTLWDKDKFN